MDSSRGSLGRDLRLGAAVVQTSPPVPADGFVQRGAGKQPLEVRRELLESHREPAAGVTSRPGSPVLLVEVPVAVRSRDEL